VLFGDQIFSALIREGLSEKEARARIWLLDKNGLLMKENSLLSFQAPYAKDMKDVMDWQLRNLNEISLYDVVRNVEPTILIGCSTATGAFTEEIVKLMAAKVGRPIIMPLSNPTSLAEAKPEHLINWTEANAIIATGSPFPDVSFGGRWFRIAQSNNAFAFPGIGLGVIVAKATRLSDDMLWAATHALSECSPVKQDITAPLLPKLAEARMVSSKVAFAVADQARKEGLSGVASDLDFKQAIRHSMWEPKYHPYHKVK
jgi:malate dehydrogenase (oxaloacetate-decarboxylating)